MKQETINLRDYFAARIAPLCIIAFKESGFGDMDVAAISYLNADAMIQIRKSSNEEIKRYLKERNIIKKL